MTITRRSPDAAAAYQRGRSAPPMDSPPSCLYWGEWCVRHDASSTPSGAACEGASSRCRYPEGETALGKTRPVCLIHGGTRLTLAPDCNKALEVSTC